MTTTVNRNYSTPATGAEVNVWGANDINPNFALIDNNLGGVISVALTNANVTLNSSQYQCGTIILTGALSGNVVVSFPAVQGWWTVVNQCTGNFYVAIATTGGTNQIGLPPGEAYDVYATGATVGYRNLPIQIGGYLDDCGVAIPSWITACTVPPYLLCDGSTFSSGTYPYLYQRLGNSTTLPDLRGRSRFYLNGGTNRITTGGSGVDGDTRFSAGGAQSTSISQGNLPAVNFTVSGITLNPFSVPSTPLSGAGTGSSGVITASANSGPFGVGTPTIATQGAAASGGSNQAFAIIPPIQISGITMIRAG